MHIGQVLDVFDADVRPRVKAAIDNAGRGLGDHGDEFRAALVELAPFLHSARLLTREFAVRRDQTRRMVHNFALITDELSRRDNEVTRLVTAGGSALGELGAVDRPLSELIAQMPPTLRQLQQSFTTMRAAADELDPAFTALRPTARALPSGLRALERLAPDLRDGAGALRRPMPRLTALLRTTRPLAADLAAAFGALRPQLPRLDRITSAVVPCELAIQKFFAWTLSIGKFYDEWGVRPRGEVLAGTNSVANGNVHDPELTAGKSCAKGGPSK